MTILSLPGSYALHASVELAKFLHNRFAKGERTPENKNIPTVSGLEAASVLNQLHYWLQNGYGTPHAGMNWIYNTYEEWQEQLPYISEYRLRQIFKWLKNHKFILTEKLNKHNWDHTLYYTIDYPALARIGVTWQNDDGYTDKTRIRVLTKQTENTENTSTARIKGSQIPESKDHLFNTKNTNKEYYQIQQQEEAVVVFGEKEKMNFCQPVGSSILDCSLVADGIKTPHPPTPLAPCDNEAVETNDKATLDFQYKLFLVAEEAIPINETVEKVVASCTEEEIVEAVNCFNELKEEGKIFSNPAGWLVGCLKGQWWVDSPSRQKKRLIEGAIKGALEKYGHDEEDYEQFFAYYWEAVEQDAMLDFEEREWEGDRAGYLLINKFGIWVRGLNDTPEGWKEIWQRWQTLVANL
jgi:hypothetical protein